MSIKRGNTATTNQSQLQLAAKKLKPEDGAPVKHQSFNVADSATSIQPLQSSQIKPQLRPQKLTEHEVMLLHQFDLNPSLGPCMSISRSQRWLRAHRLGKQPPRQVMDVIERVGAEADVSILEGRV
jgi:DNA polymerase delta subunit 4